jgi:hypothetical protein
VVNTCSPTLALQHLLSNPADMAPSATKKPKLQYHIAPKDEKTTSTHRYIHYSSHSGVVSVSTSSVQTPVMHLPEPVMHQPEKAIKSLTEFEDTGDVCIDQVYLHHIEEQLDGDVETMEKVKRVRFKGV